MILEYSLTGLVLILFFVIFNLLRKVEKQEDIITDQQKYMKRVSEVIEESNTLIRTVDERGIFESDDDIGSFFKYLKIIQETLDTYKISNLDGKKTE